MNEKDKKDTINKEDILFVTAETGYGKIGLEKGGYHVLHPYGYRTIIGRVILEVLVRLNAPQTFIFNKKILKNKYRYIIVEDSIITKQFLIWIRKRSIRILKNCRKSMNKKAAGS